MPQKDIQAILNCARLIDDFEKYDFENYFLNPMEVLKDLNVQREHAAKEVQAIGEFIEACAKIKSNIDKDAMRPCSAPYQTLKNNFPELAKALVEHVETKHEDFRNQGAFLIEETTNIQIIEDIIKCTEALKKVCEDRRQNLDDQIRERASKSDKADRKSAASATDEKADHKNGSATSAIQDPTSSASSSSTSSTNETLSSNLD